MGSLVTVGDGLASYSCEDGYMLLGERTRACRDGVWRGTVPVCEGNARYNTINLKIHLNTSEVECPDPKSPTNGYIEVSNFNGIYQFGSVATYRCNPGYILWGNSSRSAKWVCKPEGYETISDSANLMDTGQEVLHPAIPSAVGILQSKKMESGSFLMGLLSGCHWPPIGVFLPSHS